MHENTDPELCCLALGVPNEDGRKIQVSGGTVNRATSFALALILRCVDIFETGRKLCVIQRDCTRCNVISQTSLGVSGWLGWNAANATPESRVVQRGNVPKQQKLSPGRVERYRRAVPRATQINRHHTTYEDAEDVLLSPPPHQNHELRNEAMPVDWRSSIIE